MLVGSADFDDAAGEKGDERLGRQIGLDGLGEARRMLLPFGGAGRRSDKKSGHAFHGNECKCVNTVSTMVL
jgi:hypothetical protein